jgi:hypothetical protein
MLEYFESQVLLQIVDCVANMSVQKEDKFINLLEIN